MFNSYSESHSGEVTVVLSDPAFSEREIGVSNTYRPFEALRLARDDVARADDTRGRFWVVGVEKLFSPKPVAE